MNATALLLLALLVATWLAVFLPHFSRWLRETARSRRTARNRAKAASVLASTFVGSCGHTIGIPADLPPTIDCPACGRSHVQVLVTAQPAKPAPGPVPTAEELARWRAAFERVSTVPLPGGRELSVMRQAPPEEVFDTVGPESSERLEPDGPVPLVLLPNLSGEDIEDVSDEIDTSDIQEA